MTDVASLLNRFVPASIEAPTSKLSADVREALPDLVRAMRAMDGLYRRQVGPASEAAFAKGTASGDEATLTALGHFNGPYDKLDGGKPWMPGVPPTIPQRGVYAESLTEEDLDAFVADHPESKEAIFSPYTVVESDANGLRAKPYGEAYADLLAPAVEGLRKAAAKIEHAGLRAFLDERADALAGRSPLRDSDASWVRLTDAPLEVVIGPFEVYEDDFKGIKAFYEGMLLQVDHDAGASLATIEENLGELAKLIPVPEGAKPAMGGIAPMVVADEIIATGEGYAGLLASAFNLPNDPWVRGEVGWKQIMIKNVMQAKFEHCSAPIARRVLAADQVDDPSFDAYFYFVLLHEVSHGLGPAYRADGRSTNEACGKYYTPLEEAKADIGSLVLLLEKTGTCGIPELPRRSIGASYLAGLYRSIRFGLHEAHGKANVVEYNFLREAGALVRDDASGKIRVDHDKLLEGAHGLLNALTRLQSIGSPDELVAFLERYGNANDELVAAVESLSDLPIDIRPIYTIEG